MRRILLLFMLVLLVFTSISYADNHYRIVVYPGPGNTTIVFTDTTSYEIQYDSNYNTVIDVPGIVEIVLNNPTSSTVSEIVEIALSGYIDVSDIDFDTIYFIDEYGDSLYFYYENSIIYFETGDIQANSNYTVYMFYGIDNGYHDMYYKNDLVYVNETIVFNDPGILSSIGYFYATVSIEPYNDDYALYVSTDAQKYHVVYYNVKLDTSKPVKIWVLIDYPNNSGIGVAGVYPDPNDRYVYNPDNYIAKIVNNSTVKEKYSWVTFSKGVHNVSLFINGNTVTGTVDSSSSVSLTDDNKFPYICPGTSSRLVSGGTSYYVIKMHFEGYKYLDHHLKINSVNKISAPFKIKSLLTNDNGLYAIMASRYKSWFAIGDGSSYPVRIVYDSGFTFWIGSEQVGGGDIGYDNDYFLYRIKYLPSEGWGFYIDDFYTGQYLSKSTGDNSIFTFNETYITEPYLFYVVFSPLDGNPTIVRIRAPPGYYVDNVTVQYMYAYYQNDNVYIYFDGNDAVIKIGYNHYYTSYYPFIVEFYLISGDLPDRNTYDASRDPYSGSVNLNSDNSSGSNNTELNIPNAGAFDMFILNAMLFAAIFLPSVFLYKRYWLFPVLVGLLVLARIGYMFFYVPIVVFTIFVTMMFLREYIAEEYSLLVGLIMGYFMNVFIISGNSEYAPEPPSNPLDIPGYLNDLLTKAITFSYLPSPFNMIMTIFFVSLVVFATIRLVVRIVRGV